MFYAINALRNYKQYKSIQVHQDLSLQETENNKWVAPKEEIDNYGSHNPNDELILIYVKQSSGERTNAKGESYEYIISPYFRSAKNKTGVKFKKNTDHIRVQNFLFNYIINNQDKLKLCVSEKIINYEKKDFYFTNLNELGLNLDSIDTEITVKAENNKKRADIFVEINNKQEIYGKALCIEIQLSPQSKEETEKRTYDRALLGMSTIWIFKHQFDIQDKQIRLNKDEFVIYPYINVLTTKHEKAQEIIRIEYEKQGILLDNKIDEIKKVLNNYDATLNPEKNKLCQKCLNGILVRRYRKSDNKPFIACNSRVCENIINVPRGNQNA